MARIYVGPLLALCNVLFTRGLLTLPHDMKQVSFDHLVAILKTHLRARLEETILKGKEAGEWWWVCRVMSCDTHVMSCHAM